jgi:hypothetical protein
MRKGGILRVLHSLLGFRNLKFRWDIIVFSEKSVFRQALDRMKFIGWYTNRAAKTPHAWILPIIIWFCHSILVYHSCSQGSLGDIPWPGPNPTPLPTRRRPKIFWIFEFRKKNPDTEIRYLPPLLAGVQPLPGLGPQLQLCCLRIVSSD